MKSKNITKTLLLAFGLSILISSSATADHSFNLTQKCEEITQYFNPALPEPGPNDLFNTVQQNCENLNHHLSFPGAHKSPINLNEHKPSIKTKHQPRSLHKHRYINDSEEKLNQSITVNGQKKTVNFYFESIVDTFEIDLQSDFTSKIALGTVECSGLQNGDNCNGTGSLGINDFGKDMFYEVSFNQNNGTVKWHFPGQSKGPNYAKPVIVGKNPTLDKLNKSKVDSTITTNRMMEMEILFNTKDNQAPSWSATSTSKILIKDLVAKVPPNTPTTSSSWEVVPEPSNDPGEYNNYYWFNIGTTTTIWEKVTPEVKPNICEDLKLNPPQKLTDAQVKDYTGSVENGPIYRLSLKSLKFSDTFFPGNAQVTWKSEDPNGKFWVEDFFGGLAQLNGQEFSRPINFTLSENQIWYSGKGPVSARITGLPAEQISKTCNDSIQIPVEETECKEILIDHNDKIYTDTVSTFKAHSIDTKDKKFSGKITYTVDAGYGEFYSKKPTGIPDNPSKMVYQATPVSAIAPLPGGILLNPNGKILITPNVLIGNTYDATIKNTYNTIFGLATGDFNLDTLPNYIDLNPIDKNNWENFDMTAPPINPIPMDISPVDPSPLSSLFLADVFNLPTQEDLTKPGLIAPDFIKPQSFFETITVDADTTVYFVAKKPSKGKNVIHVRTQGTTVKNCGRDFDIEPKPAQICSDLGFIATPASPWIVGQTGSIDINPKDTDGKSLPTSTKIKLTTTAGGKFTTDTNLKGFIDLNGSATNNQFPIQFQNSDKEGTVTIELDPTDPAYSPSCKGTIDVKKPTEEDLVCKNLTLEPPITKLEGNKLYNFKGVATYSKTNTNTITYSMDSDYGAFLTTNISSYDYLSFILQSAQSQKIITTKSTLDDILNYFDYPSSVSTLVKPQGEGVTLVTFSGIQESSISPLHVSETVVTNPNCKVDVPISPEEKPADKIECVDLTITNPSSPWIVGKNDDTQLFQIKVDTNPAGKEQELDYVWKISGEGKWKSESKLIRTLTDFDEDTEVEVYETTKSSICSDYIQAQKEKEDRKPTIEKVVFPSNNIKDYNDFINISSKIPYLTYMIVFHPGDADNAQISDLKLEDGKIKAKGSLEGTLDFNGGISINIIKKGEKINIYNTKPRYKSDNYRTHPYSDKNFATSNSSDYECKDDSDDICYEENIEDAVKNFINGKEPIKFKNLDKLGTDGSIIIKYQMTNNTAINEAVCKTLKKECGEEFNNTAEFAAQKEGKPKPYTGKDSAKTIVICPYILTRSGGDVFFHDVIDTGIDVAQCSEVKGHSGPGITPTPVNKAKVVKTGAGDLPTGITLDVPSHDVCRYSNIGSNVEGYNDVLKHFSSTICELRADVSKKWQEDNINKSIAANITRIARWGQNITDMNSRINATNKQSGVFVHIGSDLIINNGIPTVQGDGIPTAQTYIVKGGNLIITEDIKYPPTTNYINPKNIPSYAFIVIDGNIEIAKGVKHIDGILMAVNLDGKGDDGKVVSNGVSEELLTINGNLIGNVYDLFSNRIGVGDPAKDEGSVTIRYDSRILLNTPPGISELINIQQAIVPN